MPPKSVAIPSGAVIGIPEGATVGEPADTTPTPEPSALQKLNDFIGGAYNNYNVGLLKGAGQTVVTAAQALNSIPLVGKYLAPQEGINALRGMSQPQGIAQHAGSIAESAGEMAITGGPLKKGATMVAGAIAPKLIPAAKIVAEGVNTGLNAGMHGENVGVGAALGAGGAAASELLPLAVNPIRKAAINQYQKFLNPTKEATKNMAEDIAPELIQRGEVAMSGASLENRAANKTAKLGSQIDQAVSSVPVSVKPDTKPVLDALEKYKQSFVVNGVPVNEAGVANAQKLQDMVNQLGPDISYQSLNRVRQILDKSVAQGGGYVGKTLADGATIDAQREAANAIRKELSRQSPDIAKINAEFHFWRQVEDVMGATNSRKIGQQGGLGRVLGPIIGGGGGFAHGGIEGAASGAALMFIANEAVRSPAWRTVSAVAKDRFANAIASGDVGKAAIFLGRIGSASQSSLRTIGNMPPTQALGQMQ